MDKLPKQLKNLMKRQKINESALARKVNIPQPVISRLLSGATSNPRVSTLLALAQYFNITIEALIGADNLPSETMTKSAHYIYIHTEKTLLDDTTPQQMMMSSVQDKSAFAYQINNNLLQPIFHSGTTLIISPEKKYSHESFILVKNNNAIYVRQVVILETQKIWLSIPSIPSMIEAMDESITVIGTVIESYCQHQ